MPQMIQCTSCEKKFRLPANLPPGKKFRCPGCKAVLTVPEPEPEPVDLGEVAVAEDAEPAPKRRAEPPPIDDIEVADEPSGAPESESEADVWPLVARGAGIHVIAHGLYLGALFLLLIFVFVGTSSEAASNQAVRGMPPAKETFPEILAFLTTVAWVVGLLGALVAVTFWLIVPWRHGSRGLAIALLVLTFLSVERNSNPAAGLEGGTPLLLFLFEGVRLTVLALFMQSMGRAVRQSSLTGTARLLSIVTPSALGGVLLLCFIIAKIADPSTTLAKIVICLEVLTLAGMVAWSLLVLMSLTAAVRRKGGKRA